MTKLTEDILIKAGGISLDNGYNFDLGIAPSHQIFVSKTVFGGFSVFNHSSFNKESRQYICFLDDWEQFKTLIEIITKKKLEI